MKCRRRGCLYRSCGRPEEAPAVETATPVVEEVVDTVKEETVTEVKE